MEYYKILNLAREPFSNSPEPEFFYGSPHHVECLQKLELAIRLRRGLNVVTGNVGTGKTTLSRQLIRKFSADSGVVTHLLLDPHFSTERELLATVAEMFGLAGGGAPATEWQLREGIKKYLFDESVKQSRLIVLIIDEGQKMPDFGLEILREFLNYETNEYKLLQIVIFAQEEFSVVLKRNPGFADRINLSYNLGPLNFRDTRAMVLFRMEQAMEKGKEVPVKFTWWGMRELYRETEGYPRKIVKTCHQLLLALIIQNRKSVGRRLVRSVSRGELAEGRSASPAWGKPVVLVFLVMIFLLVLFDKGYFSGIAEEASSVMGLAEKAEKMQVIHAKAPLPIPTEPPAAIATETSLAGLSENDGHKATDIASAKSEPEVKERPSLLGQVKVSRNDTVWHIVQDIYGSCDGARLRLVAEVNPHLRNLDRIVEGDIVRVPAIEAEVSDDRQSLHFVEIANMTELRDALAAYRDYRQLLPQVKMLPYWNDIEGLRFSLVLRDGFGGEEAARQVLSALPVDIAEKAGIKGQWKEGTVFFAGVEETRG